MKKITVSHKNVNYLYLISGILILVIAGIMVLLIIKGWV